MISYSKTTPTYAFMGLGQDETPQDWMETIFQPFAHLAQEYYDIQAQQERAEHQTFLSSVLPSVKGVNPLYIIGIGLVAFYLLRKRKK